MPNMFEDETLEAALQLMAKEVREGQPRPPRKRGQQGLHHGPSPSPAVVEPAEGLVPRALVLL